MRTSRQSFAGARRIGNQKAGENEKKIDAGLTYNPGPAHIFILTEVAGHDHECRYCSNPVERREVGAAGLLAGDRHG